LKLGDQVNQITDSGDNVPWRVIRLLGYGNKAPVYEIQNAKKTVTNALKIVKNTTLGTEKMR
jgi:hypothetical protein